MSVQTALFIGGAFSEFVGIILIAFPDLLPGARRVSARLARTARTVDARLRRLLRLPGRQRFVSLSGSLSAASGLSASGVVGPKHDATPEELLEYLVRRDRATQERLNGLMNRLDILEKGVPDQLGQLRESMEAHVAQELAAAAREYRSLRVVGTFALAFGLACVTVANFV